MDVNKEFKIRYNQVLSDMDYQLYETVLKSVETNGYVLDPIVKNRLKQNFVGSVASLNKVIERLYKRDASIKELNNSYAATMCNQMKKALKNIGMVNNGWIRDVFKALTDTEELNEYIDSYIVYLKVKEEEC